MRRPTMALAMVPDELTRSALELVLAAAARGRRCRCASARSRSSPACRPTSPISRAARRSARARSRWPSSSRDREVLFEALRARLFSLSGPDDIDPLLAGRRPACSRSSARDRAAGRAWTRAWRACTRCCYAGRIADADAALAEMERALRATAGARRRSIASACARSGASSTATSTRPSGAGTTPSTHAVRAGVSYAEMLRDAHVLEPRARARRPQRGSSTSACALRERCSGCRVRCAQASRGSPRRQASSSSCARQLASLGDPSDYPARRQLPAHAREPLGVRGSDRRQGALRAAAATCSRPTPSSTRPTSMGYYLGSVVALPRARRGALGKSAQARRHFEHALDRNRAHGLSRGRRAHAASRSRARAAPRPDRRAHAICSSAPAAEAQALGMRGAVADADAALASR